MAKYPYQVISAGMMQAMEDQLEVELTFFRHLRHFTNGERYEYCNCPEWLTVFYKSKFYHLSWLDGPPALYQDALFAWDATDHQSDSWEAMGDLANDFNLHHGVSIVRRHPDYVDAFEFSVGAREMALNVLANYHPEELHALVDYYLQSILPGLTPQSDKIVIDEPEKFQPQWRAFHWNRYKQSACHQLTRQQQACLNELSSGQTSKEIARVLSISARTVEYHLDLCRERLNTSNRMSMISIWLGFQRMKNAFPYLIHANECR